MGMARENVPKLCMLNVFYPYSSDRVHVIHTRGSRSDKCLPWTLCFWIFTFSSLTPAIVCAKSILLSVLFVLFKQGWGIRMGALRHTTLLQAILLHARALAVFFLRPLHLLSGKRCSLLPVGLCNDSREVELCVAGRATRFRTSSVWKDFRENLAVTFGGGLMSKPRLSLDITSAHVLSYSITHPFSLFTLWWAKRTGHHLASLRGGCLSDSVAWREQHELSLHF